MQSTKPPSGTRDFLPEDIRRREYVISVVRGVYERYGFEPLETPAFENIETLLGKYGDEGNKLIFKILRRGEHEARGEADLALRYDLTVPLARVVAQYQQELPKFFKRYQIQPVWRADRPAKGRFREFYQCDVDITGTTSLLAETEVVNAISEVLVDLGFRNVSIALNHRVVLRSMIEVTGIGQALEGTALVAIDKLDKIGPAGVQDELVARGIAPEAAQHLLDLTTVAQDKDNTQTLKALREMLPTPQAQQALNDLATLCQLTAEAPAGPRLRIAPALARGLSYYTGPIFEVVSEDFSGKQVPAVGFSLGLERILLLMEEQQMFPALPMAAQVMVCPLPDTPLAPVVGLTSRLRQAGIRVELSPEQTRLGRQLTNADDLHIPYALIIGPDEVTQRRYTLKQLATGTQQQLSEAELLAALKQAYLER